MSIAWVGGANNSAASAATIAATYSPVAGNAVIVFVAVGGAVTKVSVQDNVGRYLATGPIGSGAIPLTVGSGYLYSFFGLAGAGATAYTANWTTSQVSSIVVGEYSGAAAIYFLPTSAYYANATGTTASITLSTLDANDWIVMGAMNNSSAAFTPIALNNLRENSGVGQSCACAIVDSGVIAAVNTSRIVQVTVGASAAWGSFAFQLRPFAGGGYLATNTVGATAAPNCPNPILAGMQTMKGTYPSTGKSANTGVVYGNTPASPTYLPLGQTWPR